MPDKPIEFAVRLLEGMRAKPDSGDAKYWESVITDRDVALLASKDEEIAKREEKLCGVIFELQEIAEALGSTDMLRGRQIVKCVDQLEGLLTTSPTGDGDQPGKESA